MIVRPGMMALVVEMFVAGTEEVVEVAAAQTAAVFRHGPQLANLDRTVRAALAGAR